jgi:hypothetical protein
MTQFFTPQLPSYRAYYQDGSSDQLLPYSASNSDEENNNEYEPESYTSSESDDDLDPLIFKITTDITETNTYDGANLILLAQNIKITDGVMEITLDPRREHNRYKRNTDFDFISSSDDETSII